MKEIKKAVIPIAGLATKFLPLSKTMPKVLWPLVDKPVIQYIVDEVKNSGIHQIVFVVNSDRKFILEYFKKSSKVEEILKKRKNTDLLLELKKSEDLFKNLSFSNVIQKKPLGDGHAILQAAKFIDQEPFAVLFGDDIVDGETPCISQLSKIFKTCQSPVLALSKVPKEKTSLYGMVKVERISNRLYKIKKIIEKPSLEDSPSDLAIVGKYILTPEVFKYLKLAKPAKNGEIILAEVLDKMLKDGKIIYGYEFKGKWLECGNKLSWLKSHLYFSLKHPEFGPKLKEYLKEL